MGGLPEVVTHGETGFLFPLGNVEEMAEAGVSLLKDQALWTRFSDAARADSVARFSNEAVVPMYEGLYQDVLDGNGHVHPEGGQG
jgi:glycosyltransferase involved in cell wall biosynthesis